MALITWVKEQKKEMGSLNEKTYIRKNFMIIRLMFTFIKDLI